jgi:hypothetical protein
MCMCKQASQVPERLKLILLWYSPGGISGSCTVAEIVFGPCEMKNLVNNTHSVPDALQIPNCSCHFTK